MTVSFAEATAAARRIQAGYPHAEYPTSLDEQRARLEDADLLAAFVLAGDTERLRTDIRRLLALALVATGGEMTPEGDALVPQGEWDALFSDGLMEQRRPLHGEPYAVLLEAGRNEMERLRAALGEGGV